MCRWILYALKEVFLPSWTNPKINKKYLDFETKSVIYGRRILQKSYFMRWFKSTFTNRNPLKMHLALISRILWTWIRTYKRHLWSNPIGTYSHFLPFPWLWAIPYLIIIDSHSKWEFLNKQHHLHWKQWSNNAKQIASCVTN